MSNYDPQAVIQAMDQWRKTEYPQLLTWHVVENTIPRFAGAHPLDKYLTPPEVSLVLRVRGGYPWTPEELIHSLQQIERDFYSLLAVDGVVPAGKVAYRKAFWTYVPHEHFCATLCYVNPNGYAESAVSVVSHN